MKPKHLLALAALTLLIPLQAQNPGAANTTPQVQEKSTLPTLVFAPQWLPQAQFAGYYVAQDQGFYRDAGVEIEIIHPSASIQTTALLASGKADVISLFLVTAITARNKGLDMVNIAQLSQHSAIMIVAKKKSGINELSQLNGKKIGIWKSGFDELPKALIAQKNLKVEWVPVLSTVNLFLMDGIDAMTVMWYNEYHQIVLSGINEDELCPFFLSKYGFDIPEDGLYCLRSTLNTKREALQKFVEATLRGWEYAALNRSYALDVVEDRMNKAHIPSNRAHQAWMLDKMIELIDPDQKTVKKGQLLQQDYQKAISTLDAAQPGLSHVSFGQFYIPLVK